MAVHYKFKSAMGYDSIAMDGPFVSVGTLKDKIFESKHLGSGKDFDLLITNAQTNEVYLDEAVLIPKNTSVLIQRVPGRPRMPIVIGQESNMIAKVEDAQPSNANSSVTHLSASEKLEEEWDEFRDDIYSTLEEPAAQSRNSLPVAIPRNDKANEDRKIQALINTPALDWQWVGVNGFGSGRGYGRSTGGRGFGRLGMGRITLPAGYVCHRCNVAGHLIQHCPTNGDPAYDINRVKPPTGIPKSMLVANPDGSYALPSGAVAILKPNEDAFDKEMEGLSSTHSVGEISPELRCPLCKEVMKYAVLTSKCCFRSFCDKCIRDHIISKSMCVCGEKNILGDDLLPNKTLRDTIKSILESGNSSTDNPGSISQVQDVESACRVPPKVPSPATSAASTGQPKVPSSTDEGSAVTAEREPLEAVSAKNAQAEAIQAAKPVVASQVINDTAHVKEEASQVGARVPEEGHRQMVSGEQGGKKHNKKARLPVNDMQWNPVMDLAAQNYMMHMGPPAFYPYWDVGQPGFNGITGPYPGFVPPMNYGLGPVNMAYGGVMSQPPFHAQGGFGFPGIPPPHRDLAELGMHMNVPRPKMSREEYEARNTNTRKKLENERRCGSGDSSSKNREKGKQDKSGMDESLMKPKALPHPSRDHNRNQHQTELRPKRNSDRRERSPERDYDHVKRTRDYGRESDKEAAARKRRKVSSYSSRTESLCGGHRSQKDDAVSSGRHPEDMVVSREKRRELHCH